MKIATTIDAVPRRVLLLLGSNVDAQRQLDAALAQLRARFPVYAVSAQHLSPAAGRSDAPAYLNQAAVIASELGRDRLKSALREIEALLGRQRPAVDPKLCAIDIDTLGCWAPDWCLWDGSGYAADYARLPLRDLGLS